RASTAALTGDQECVQAMNAQYKVRHDAIVAGLNALPGISCLPAAGTFYAFANTAGAQKLSGTKDDHAFAEFLINEAGVAVVPGSGFGAPDHMRLSFACSMQTIEEGLKRTRAALESR